MQSLMRVKAVRRRAQRNSYVHALGAKKVAAPPRVFVAKGCSTENRSLHIGDGEISLYISHEPLRAFWGAQFAVIDCHQPNPPTFLMTRRGGGGFHTFLFSEVRGCF